MLLAHACAPIIISVPTYPPAPREEPQRRHHAVYIPKGHLPPPGHCRIWYPSKPPGHQPPPQRCPIPSNQIPLGAYVVSRVGGDNKHAMVKIYDDRRAGVVIDTQYLNYKDN